MDRMIRQITSRLDLLKIIARPRLEDVVVGQTPTGPVLDAARPVSATASLATCLSLRTSHE
jgi:hypothetical protein